jgi:hypothetical protein
MKTSDKFPIPIVLFAYERPEKTELVLKQILEIKPAKLYVFIDGPKRPEDEPKCKEVRKLIDQIKDVHIIKYYGVENRGVGRQLPYGLDIVFELEESAIILEDDIIATRSFFKFCAECLNKYKDNPKIYHISGCNAYEDINVPDSSYYFSHIVSGWGWATWKRAWETFDHDLTSWRDQKDTDFFSDIPINKREKEFWIEMFDVHYMNKDPWAWDYQWTYACWNNKALAITPQISLVENIGFDEESSNTTCKPKKIIRAKTLGDRSYIPLKYIIIKRSNEKSQI